MTIAQQRASLYDSFATLYAREIGRETLFRLTDPNAAWPFLQALSVLEPDAFARLQVALAPIAALEPAEALLELRADFTHAFLLAPASSAAPYASLYLSDGNTAKQLYGEHEALLRHFLNEQHLAIHPDFPEPADHLAILLATAASLARNEAASGVQRNFISAALNAWLPAFNERCQQLTLRFDFYPALSPLLLEFVVQDLAFLDSAAN